MPTIFESILILLLRAKFFIDHLIATCFNPFLPRLFPSYKIINPNRKNAILITGSSTGIGRSLAEYLAFKGYTVFAGIRDPKCIEELKLLNSLEECKGEIIPVILDVTVLETIEKCAERIQKYMVTLDVALVAVVNNAGISGMSPIEIASDELVKSLFETNVFSLIKMSRTFLPLLKTTNGRIVNVGSIAADSSVTPNGLYCATKAALDSISDALRQELAPLKISVSVVKPGGVRTQIFKKQMLKKSLKDQKKAYSASYKWLYPTELKLLGAMDDNSWDPIVTVKCIEHALEAKFPQFEYYSGLDSVVMQFLGSRTPKRVLNAFWDIFLKNMR